MTKRMFIQSPTDPHATLVTGQTGTGSMAVIEHAAKPLLHGERLTLEEFLRRWEQQPDLKFAELIEGVVYLPSPVGVAHGDEDYLLAGWAMHYTTRTPGCRGGNNATWLMRGNAPQPDIHLRILPE